MMRPSVLVLAVVALASACVDLSVPAPEIHQYRIDYTPPPISGKPLPVVLRVVPFETVAIYERDAIVYRENPHSAGTYYYHRWMAAPADMVTDLLTRDLVASGLYETVQRGAGLITADYQLNGVVEEMEESVKAGGCSAHLALRVLLTASTRPYQTQALFQRRYEVQEPCEGNEASSFVNAMSSAMKEISRRIQDDVHAAIAGRHAPGAS